MLLLKLPRRPSLDILYYLSEILIQQYSTSEAALWLCIITHQTNSTAQKVKCVKVVDDAAEQKVAMI